MADPSHTLQSGPTPEAKRLDVYVVDTGWNEKAKKVLDAHLEMFEEFLSQHHVFVLSKEQSVDLLKRKPELIGEDPLLVVVDPEARMERRSSGFGVRVALGVSGLRDRPEKVLRQVLRALADPEKSRDICATTRKGIHRGGLNGAIEIIGDTLESLRG